ncbi:MAG: hypothetical protein A2Y41_11390 [Spirochaetes bacterium GWB1_36_13]|nr:MAG: hypothetical protein A2Y41_11390 [Spirochaetes bacterium GWB1_36_13]
MKFLSKIKLIFGQKYLATPWIVFGFLFLLTLSFKLIYLFDFAIRSPDEFFYIQGAKSLLDGKVLYKDFGEIKPPGIFFLYFFFQRFLDMKTS